MANPTSPPRLSPAELRRRLLAPPTDAASAPVIPEEAPPVVRPAARRDTTRYATQMAIDLDALMQEASPGSGTRLTPLPEGRLDPTQFRQPEKPAPAPTQSTHSMPSFQLPPAVPAMPAHAHGADELTLLRLQNAELTRLIEEMRPLIEEATAQELVTQNNEKEFQDKLAEKDLLLEQAQLQVKDLEEKLAAVPPPKIPKTRDELEEWSDELEKDNAKLTQERKRLDEDRRQLREDEEALERQMREMECSMARERAMMARQETELKRLSAEIQHELELLQRGDGTLREQLSKFQRRHQEVLSRTSPAAMSAPAAVAEESAPAVPTKKDSGLFGRIFRGGK
jgi:hypothetical protein